MICSPPYPLFTLSLNLNFAPTLVHYLPLIPHLPLPSSFLLPLRLPLDFFSLPFVEYLFSPPPRTHTLLLGSSLCSSYRQCLALKLPVSAQPVLLLSPPPVSYLSQHRQSGCRSTDNPPACRELIHDKPPFLSVPETGLRSCFDNLLHLALAKKQKNPTLLSESQVVLE